MTDKQTHFYDYDGQCMFHFERPPTSGTVPYILDQRASEQNKKDYAHEYNEYLAYNKHNAKPLVRRELSSTATDQERRDYARELALHPEYNKDPNVRRELSSTATEQEKRDYARELALHPEYNKNPEYNKDPIKHDSDLSVKPNVPTQAERLAGHNPSVAPVLGEHVHADKLAGSTAPFTHKPVK